MKCHVVVGSLLSTTLITFLMLMQIHAQDMKTRANVTKAMVLIRGRWSFQRLRHPCPVVETLCGSRRNVFYVHPNVKSFLLILQKFSSFQILPSKAKGSPTSKYFESIEKFPFCLLPESRKICSIYLLLVVSFATKLVFLKIYTLGTVTAEIFSNYLLYFSLKVESLNWPCSGGEAQCGSKDK